MDDDVAPMQIGIVILGDWKYTKKPLEYLTLYLNTKQSLFEYQLFSFDAHYESVLSRIDEMRLLDFYKSLNFGRQINSSKTELKHDCDLLAQLLKDEILVCSSQFDSSQIPQHYIFISTASHADQNFFQHDGQNGFDERSTKGAVILSGHHNKKLTPPTILEFIFKFIFRISIKWRNPDFKRNSRHYGEKGCLFDCNSDINLCRYMILNNFICHNCKKHIVSYEEILEALNPSHLYGDAIDRHPARVTANLGFNLSLTKGIYKTRMDILLETLNTAFVARVGSVAGMGLMFWLALSVGVKTGFINED
tara:strand:- start:1785 stop:2705 length:921 start_codon:yes stop_codon:yes gene_type:complete